MRIIILLLLFLPVVAFASAAPADIANNLDTFSRPTGIPQDTVTTRITEGMIVAYQVTGIIFFIIALYAGFMWLTAQGNEDAVKKARGLLIGAVVGILLIVGAYGITIFVTEQLSDDFGTSSSYAHIEHYT